MKIVDGQIHTWRPNTPEHPWVSGNAVGHGPSYTTEAALAQMDAAGVAAAILVPPSWTGTDNSYALEAARKYPDRFAVMGRFNFASPDAARQLAGWRDIPGMLGIRATLTDPLTISMFTDPAYRWFFQRCADLGLPLMVYAPGEAIGVAGKVAHEVPDLRIIFDHAARHAHGPKDDPAWENLGHLLDLAKLSNVAVKASSLPSFSTDTYPFSNLHPWIRRIYDAFGPDRMIWGSDVTRLTCPYQDNIRLFAEALDFLTEKDRRQIFASSIARWCDAPFQVDNSDK